MKKQSNENIKIVRVGEKNNFNFTQLEINELNNKWKTDNNKLFVNQNSFVTITNDFPSVITINPYLKYSEPIGDLSNVKAFRMKIYKTNDMSEFDKCIEFAKNHGVPILLTFQRWKSNESLHKFECDENAYVYDHGYYRPKKETQKLLKTYTRDRYDNVYICDEGGTGCPSCMNCVKLTYGNEYINSKVCSLNLSCSGDNGKCMFHCPDCWAKCVLAVVVGKPCCDKIIQNNKQLGNVKHV